MKPFVAAVPSPASPPDVSSPAPGLHERSSERRHSAAGTPALTLLVPTRNEADNVGPLIERIDEALSETQLEVLFVDDSDDVTAERIRATPDRAGRTIRAIHREPDQRDGGLGGAVLVGLRQARAPWVCVMDADLQHPPATVAALAARAGRGDADLIVASRYGEHGSVGSFGLVRRRLSRASAVSARVLFPRRLKSISDPMSGFFLVRREALDLERLQPRGFKILLEIICRSPKLRLAEVSFHFGERHAGETKASLGEGFRFLGQLVALRAGGLGARAGRFATVGVSGLVVNTALLALIAGGLGVNYALAALIAAQGSTLWNFVLIERWALSGARADRSVAGRMARYFGVNNAGNLLRLPLLVLLTSGLGLNYLISNLVTIIGLFVARFALADRWIWPAESGEAPREHWSYEIHGIVTVGSDAHLPELERFLVDAPLDEPTILVQLGRVRTNPAGPPRSNVNGDGPNANGDSAGVAGARSNGDGSAESVVYREAFGRGFAVRIELGDRPRILASQMLRHSPHVLYTNIVEPVLRWTLVRRGYALVHGACLAVEGEAYLITAKTDTGKTTTILKTLDAHPHAFLSDDLTILSGDGQVLTYPKPLTISRHTLHAVKTPLLGRRERLALIVQSRLHSKSGRLFGLLLAKTHLPAATLNAIVQWIVPPPKFQVDRLVPGVRFANEGRLVGMAVIQRGGVGSELLAADEALDTLMANCEDAYGFPPYPVIAPYLQRGAGGGDLCSAEREIVARALDGIPTTVLRSETMDWAQRLPDLLEATTNGHGNGTGGQPGNGSHPVGDNGAEPEMVSPEDVRRFRDTVLPARPRDATRRGTGPRTGPQ